MANTGNMRSIWDNDFYNNPPALAWTFKLIFDDFINYNILTDKGDIVEFLNNNDMSILNKSSVSITIGERKIDHIDLYYGGLKFKQTTRSDNSGTFSIKFNEDSMRSVTSVLEKIYSITGISKTYYSNNLNSTAPYMSDLRPRSNRTNNIVNKNLKQNIIVAKIFDHNKTLDNDDNIEYYRQYKFYGCRFLGMENIELNYESTDTITRNATFSYNWMEYNVLCDKREVY